MLSSPRAAVAAAFLIHSTASGTWAPRLPAIKESLGLSDGELGTALVGLAIGLVVGTRVAGLPVDRFGSRPVMRAGFPLLAAALLLPGLARNGVGLFAGLLVFGVIKRRAGRGDERSGDRGGAGAPPADSVRAARAVERRARHRGGRGGARGGAGSEPLPQFAVVAAVLGLASLLFLRGLLAGPRNTCAGDHEAGGAQARR